MLALLATLAIQALVSMAVLTPPVLVALAAPELGISSEQIGIFTAIIYAGAILSSSASGSLLGRMGPLRLSQLSLVLCTLGLAAVASAWLLLAVAGAFVMGLGYGPVTPASSQILIRQTPPARRALMFSLKQTGVPLGGAAGWRAALLGVAAASLAVALAVEPLRPGFDREEAATRAPSRVGIFAGLRLVFRIAALRRLALASVAFSATQLSFATFLVSFLTERAALSLVRAGAVMAVAQGAGIVGRIVFGWVADRLAPPGVVLALLGLGMALASVATGLISSDWPLVAIFLATALLGMTGLSWNGVYLAEVARLAPKGNAGAATGGALAVTFLGIVLGPALFSSVVSLSRSYALAFSLVAVGALMGGLGALGAARGRQP